MCGMCARTFYSCMPARMCCGWQGETPELDAAFSAAFIRFMQNVTMLWYGTPASPAKVCGMTSIRFRGFPIPHPFLAALRAGLLAHTHAHPPTLHGHSCECVGILRACVSWGGGGRMSVRECLPRVLVSLSGNIFCSARPHEPHPPRQRHADGAAGGGGSGPDPAAYQRHHRVWA